MSNGILLEVVEELNGIKEGAVVDLCTEPDRNTFFVNIALPDMIKNRMWFHGVSWHQHREQLLVDSVQSQLTIRVLRFPYTTDISI